jgi:hypothetical protein
MKKLLFLMIFISTLSGVLSLDINSSIDTNTLVKGVENKVILHLILSDAPEGLYNVYTLSDILISPLDMFQINDNSIKKEFELRASENLKTDGLYTFTYTINQRGIQKYDRQITLDILNLEEVIEVSSDNINISDNEISFYVKNLENVELKNLKAKFSSIVFETEKEFDLKPFEKKVFNVIVDGFKLKRIKAGVYVIDSTFYTNQGNKEISGTLFFGETKGISTLEKKSGILIQNEEISKVNTGNVVESVRIELTRNIISRFFTTFQEEPNIVERNGFFIKYTWLKERLGPAEILTVKAQTNYVVPFFVILFVIIILVGMKKYNKSKIIVKKSVNPVRTKNGEFALKISISIKALRSVENVVITDHIPRMVKLFNKFGTIQPTKIDPNTRTIQWKVGALGSREERIVSYIVYSKVGVVGKFSLPSARVLFEKDNIVEQVDSNFVFFMNEQTTTEN